MIEQKGADADDRPWQVPRPLHRRLDVVRPFFTQVFQKIQIHFHRLSSTMFI